MSEKNGAFDLNMKPLEDLIKALNDNSKKARVGILGDKTNRTEEVKGNKKTYNLISGQTNADIGLKHEFGTEELPMRSFLRIPIITQMQKYLDESNFFNKETLKLVLDEKSMDMWIKKIGIVGENIVGDAFENGGFGKWKPSNMTNKTVQQTLVETTQLRDSITSEVK